GELGSLSLVGDVHQMRHACCATVEVGGDDSRTLGGEQLSARSADSRTGAGDDANLVREAHGQARIVPITRASPSAIRMIAPFAASIQNVDVFRSTRTLLTRPSRTTPVNAPIIRPRPPSSAMPPITAAAKTVKIRLLPWLAVTVTTWPAVIRLASAARVLVTTESLFSARSSYMPAGWWTATLV